MQQQAVPAAGVQLHRPELGARPAVVEPVRRRVRGGVTQIIRRDDLMTRRRGAAAAGSGSLVARCRTAPVQQNIPTLAPPPAMLVADM